MSYSNIFNAPLSNISIIKGNYGSRRPKLVHLRQVDSGAFFRPSILSEAFTGAASASVS